jgi:hypothetical protein
MPLLTMLVDAFGKGKSLQMQRPPRRDRETATQVADDPTTGHFKVDMWTGSAQKPRW